MEQNQEFQEIPPISQVVNHLAALLNLTGHSEPDEYVLTKEEEDNAIAYEIQQAKNLFQYKHLNNGEKLDDIKLKIALTDWKAEINSDEILKRYNANKLRDIWIKESADREKKEKEIADKSLKEKHTAKYFYNLMAWTSKNIYGRDLLFIEQTKPLITALCFFLSKDERFETELGYSLKKGLLIRGISGLGKTFLAKCISKNDYQPIAIISMLAIEKIIKKEGEYDLTFKPKGIIYLDDVGTEEATVNHYGTKVNFFKNYAELFYLENQTYNKLIVSTNNSFDEIEARYGFRVRSRIKDMFNIIDIDGQDLRG